jgi:uncharacterized damage-inducible protein DinB
MVRIETVLDSWKTVREDTALAVEEFPATELDFRPVPDLAAFGEIARHILDAGHALTGMMLDGVTNLQVPEFREMLKKYISPDGNKTAGELVSNLRLAAAERVSQLQAMPPDFFSEIMTRFDGMKVTRLEMLQFVKEHELTHRSQLFLYMRLKGLVPPTTRRRLAKQGAQK